MRVGEIGLAYPMECDHCGYAWLAMVVATEIEWGDGRIEWHHGDEIECPECGLYTEIDKYEDQ